MLKRIFCLCLLFIPELKYKTFVTILEIKWCRSGLDWRIGHCGVAYTQLSIVIFKAGLYGDKYYMLPRLYPQLFLEGRLHFLLAFSCVAWKRDEKITCGTCELYSCS